MINLSRDEALMLLENAGVTATDPDEVIRSSLYRNNWHNDDIEMVLLLVRENYLRTSKMPTAVAVGVPRILESDTRLSPQEIDHLLGIKVEVEPAHLPQPKRLTKYGLTFEQIAEVALVTLLISGCVLIGGMWFFEVGMFHQTIV